MTHNIRNIILGIAVAALATAVPRIHAEQNDTDSLATALIEARADSAWREAMRPLELPTPTLAKEDAVLDTMMVRNLEISKGTQQSIYSLPPGWNTECRDWRRLWINSSVLGGAFIGTLLVLECLPEDATSWNRAELQDVPLFTRWRQHVIEEGPEWDHDKFYFNYLLHPYAGAVYFMAARSAGFNFWRSFLFCTIVSNIGWEFGIEAFMERPSYQDLIITPCVGSLIGEGFFRLKHKIVDDGYTLFGSRFLGQLCCFLIDPVNEVVGLFDGNPARKVGYENAREIRRKREISSQLSLSPHSVSLRITF